MKILYVTTISNTVNAFLIPHIQMLVEDGHQVDVAFNIEQEIDSRIFKLGCSVFEISFNRSPMSINNLKAYIELKKIIIDGKYDIVHTHTPVASFISRIICKGIHNIKVIYTAHGFHFYSGAPLLNWIIYYPIEKYLSKFTDILITINKEDYIRAKKSLKANKIEYIPGVGVDIEKIKNLSIDKAKMRAEISVPDNAFVLMSVGELNRNKNHKVVINALKKIHCNRIHYIICGEGILKEKLREMCTNNDIFERVHFLGHREDVIELYKAADLFVFPSLREGLPVSLMEAMASGLPVVCSNIRGNTDLVKDGNGGYLFHPHDHRDLEKKIIGMYILKEKNVKSGHQNFAAIMNFSLPDILKKMKYLYQNLI